MRNLKKVLALVLALMMAVSLMVTANAAVVVKDADQIDAIYQEAVDVLANLGIVEGTVVPDASEADSANKTITFDPTKNFDRGQFAKILFILYTGANPTDDQYKKYENYDYFDDLDAPYNEPWALVSINYLKERGIMIGTADRIFEPARPITGFEVVQGLLQAIGVGQRGEFKDKPYSEVKLAVAVQGEQRRITTGLPITLSDTLKRQQVAGLVFNTLTNKEAHKVTYTESTGTYIEEGTGYNKDAWVTLGEANWQLHRYGLTSGKTYASDKKIDAELKLDPFGRPTNPKWVAVVKGEVVQIGNSVPLKEYYQKDKVTRTQLTNDLYSLFAFKDMTTNIEFYVDGIKLNNPDNAWEWAYKANGDRDKDNDKIGGTGVTIDVYMMADERVAVSADLVAGLFKNNGNTVIGTGVTAYPKMRVVIVHHYAALITEDMFVSAADYSEEGKDGYASPVRLRLPYDKFDGWKDAHTVPNYVGTTVLLPLNQAKDTYKKDDVIYYSVARNNSNNNCDVYEDVNLSNKEGCKQTAPIVYAAPNHSYIRLTDNTNPAKYITYFMQHTTKSAYSASKVAVTKTAKDVYLDPTLQFVALIVNEDDNKDEFKSPDDYWYVRDVEIKVGKTVTLDKTTYTLDFVASAINAKTGDAVTPGSLTIPYVAKNEAGTAEVTQPVDISGRTGKYWHITEIADMKVDILVNAETREVIDNATTTAAATVRATEDDIVYDTKDDTDPVYIIKKDVYIYLNGTELVKDHPMVLYKDGEKDGGFVTDKNGGLIFFIIRPDGSTYVLNMYGLASTEAVAKPRATIEPVKDINKFDTDRAYDAYNTITGLTSANDAAKEAYVVLADYATTSGKFDIDETNAWKKIIDDDDDDDSDVPAKTWDAVKKLLVDQFVKNVKGKAIYTLDKTAGAVDKDASKSYDITSGILHEKETSSKVTVIKLGADGEPIKPIETASEDFYVVSNGTIVYSFLRATDETTGEETITRKGVYRYYEFEQFGTKDPNAQILVVLVKMGEDYRVSYISVISNDAKYYDTTDTYYGIYCGYDEEGYDPVLYFINPKTNKMDGAPLASYADIDLDALNKNVGKIMTYKLVDGKVSYVKIAAEPERVIDQNANYIVTPNHSYNLYNAKFYYVGSGYISNADRTDVAANQEVCVYTAYDGKTLVVIYDNDCEPSIKDGKPYYGYIDEDWEGRI